MKQHSFKLAMLSLLSAGLPADARDNALTNLLGDGGIWYNLAHSEVPNGFEDYLVHETNGEDFIYSEGHPGLNTAHYTANGDIVVEDGDGETQMTHDGDITSSNRRPRGSKAKKN